MGWWETAKPGDFVVCVAGVPTPSNNAAPIIAGTVYAIKSFFVVPEGDPRAGYVIARLAGHNNGYLNGIECGWGVKHFRPVKPLHTSIVDCLSAPASPWGVPTREHA